MRDYYAFGGCFRSELEFPDLSACPLSRTPDRFVVVSDGTIEEPGELQGAREVEPGWTLRLLRIRGGWRLEYEATGAYEILDEGRRIVWHRGSDRRDEVIRAVILGPVMALALHEAGTLCLHGSAIAVAGKGIGFLAPKGYGKSTLAVALAAAGGRLLSDDLVAIRSAGAPEILPGVHSLRMRNDVTELMADEFPGAHVRDGWKNTLTNLPEDRLCWEAVPLDALYLLEPVPDTGVGEGTERARLGSMDGALALVRHAKLTDELVGHRVAGAMLEWIAEVVARVPVYRLEIPRSLERLPSVASRILSWHGDAGGTGPIDPRAGER
jgi:hypothetical protein